MSRSTARSWRRSAPANITKAKTLLAKVSDTSLEGYVEAQHFLSASPKSLTAQPLVEWLKQYRDLAVADRIYRLAVAHSTKKVRRHHKTITVAVVTNIPAPSGVGRRTGGYEDPELPEPVALVRRGARRDAGHPGRHQGRQSRPGAER